MPRHRSDRRPPVRAVDPRAAIEGPSFRGAGIILAQHWSFLSCCQRANARARRLRDCWRAPSVKIRQDAGLLVRFASIPNNMFRRLASHRRQLLLVSSPPRMDKLWRNFRRWGLAWIISAPRCQSPLVSSSPHVDQAQQIRCGVGNRSPHLRKFFRPAGVLRRGQRRSAERSEQA